MHDIFQTWGFWGHLASISRRPLRGSGNAWLEPFSYVMIAATQNDDKNEIRWLHWWDCIGVKCVRGLFASSLHPCTGSIESGRMLSTELWGKPPLYIPGAVESCRSFLNQKFTHPKLDRFWLEIVNQFEGCWFQVCHGCLRGPPRTFPVVVALFLESWFVVSLEHFPGDIACKNLQKWR